MVKETRMIQWDITLSTEQKEKKKTVYFPADVPERTQHEDNVGLKAVLVQFVQKCIHIAFVAASCEAEEDLDVLWTVLSDFLIVAPWD